MRLLFYTISLAFLFSNCFRKESVDLILHNASIVSIDPMNNIYEAMAVQDGKIIALGKENQILNKYSSSKTIDLKSKYLYPGFIDAHCHFLTYGIEENQINLKGCVSFNEVIKRCLDYNKNSEWIIGNGWDQNLWESNSFPNKNILDSLFPNNPVALYRVDGHALLANQKALNLAGITTETKIQGGHIEIINNKLTGILVDNAMNFIASAITEPSESEKTRALLLAQKNCLAHGLTTVDDAGLNKKDIFLIDKLHQSGDLKIRIYAMLSDNKENFDYFIDSLKKPFTTERLSVRAFKFYSDGALGSRGACLIKPYSDVNDSSHYGMLLNTIDHFKESAKKLYNCDYQMCTHAIGDSAARTILNIYGNILKDINDKRWRLEHAQVINENDFPLFRKYSIIPSVQPTHATSDMLWAILRLGNKRIKNSYAYGKLLYQNGSIALGTDFPIENINPIHTFYAATARKNLNGQPKNGFQIENALTRLEALKGMTIWAAIANFEENVKGSIEIGKAADMVVLDKDLISIEEDEILETKVLYTFVAGEQVYKN